MVKAFAAILAGFFSVGFFLGTLLFTYLWIVVRFM